MLFCKREGLLNEPPPSNHHRVLFAASANRAGTFYAELTSNYRLTMTTRLATISEILTAHKQFPNAIAVAIMPDGSMIPHYSQLAGKLPPDAAAIVWIRK